MFGVKRGDFKVISKYLKPFTITYIFVFALLIISILLDLIAPMITKGIIDTALQKGDLPLFVRLLGIYVIVFLLHLFIQTYSNYKFIAISEQVFLNLRDDVFTKMLNLDFYFLKDHSLGDLMSRTISDINTIRNLLVSFVQEVFINTLTFIGTFIMLFYLNWQIALFILGMAPIYALLVRQHSKRLQVESTKNREIYGETSSCLHEYLPMIKTIQAYNKQEKIRSIFHQKLSQLQNSNILLEALKLRGNLSISLFTGFLPFFILGYSGYMIIQGQMSLGKWVAIGTYMAQIFGPLQVFVRLNLNSQISFASLKRIGEIIDSQPQICSDESKLPLTHFNHEIRFEDVSLTLGNKQILKEINFTIHKGEQIALVGETGEGKSTIIDLMLRFKDPDQGRILIDGVDLREYRVDDVRRLFSVVFQETGIFGGTFDENIHLFAEESESAQILSEPGVQSWLKKAGFLEKKEIAAGGQDLSGGQKQIIGILRALHKNSDIVVLDEPTSSQDALSEKIFKETLQKLSASSRRTMITISHKFTLTNNVDRIIFLKGGQIVAKGTTKQLLESTPLFRELYQAQILQVEGDAHAL